MMISLASVPLSSNAVAQVTGGASLPDGCQELTVLLELKCALTGDWFTPEAGIFTLQADADSDDFEDILRAKVAERVDIDQELLSETGERIKARRKLDAELVELNATFWTLAEVQGDSELVGVAKKIFALKDRIIDILDEEIEDLS